MVVYNKKYLNCNSGRTCVNANRTILKRFFKEPLIMVFHHAEEPFSHAKIHLCIKMVLLVLTVLMFSDHFNARRVRTDHIGADRNQASDAFIAFNICLTTQAITLNCYENAT